VTVFFSVEEQEKDWRLRLHSAELLNNRRAQ